MGNGPVAGFEATTTNRMDFGINLEIGAGLQA